MHPRKAHVSTSKNPHRKTLLQRSAFLENRTDGKSLLIDLVDLFPTEFFPVHGDSNDPIARFRDGNDEIVFSGIVHIERLLRFDHIGELRIVFKGIHLACIKQYLDEIGVACEVVGFRRDLTGRIGRHAAFFAAVGPH